MFVAWIGGQSGRFKHASSSAHVIIGTAYLNSLKYKLVDLEEDADAPSKSLPRLMMRLHSEFQGKLLSMVLLTIHSCAGGVMAPLNFEQRMSMLFSRCDGVACFFKIVSVACLQNPVDVTHRGQSFQKFVAFELISECVERALAQHTSQGSTAAEVCQQWKNAYGPAIQNLLDEANPSSCLQLPCHIAALASKGLWDYLAFPESSRFDRSSDIYRLREQMLAALQGVQNSDHLRQETLESVKRDGILNHNMFRTIAESLINWSTAIVSAAANDDDKQERTLRLEQMVAWLEAIEKATDESQLLESRLSTRQFGDWNDELCKFTTYKSGFLLERLVLTFGLRSASTFADTVKQAIRLLPPAWSSTLTSLMQADHSMPSAATLSRARLYIDVGFMIFLQDHFAKVLGAEQPPMFF